MPYHQEKFRFWNSLALGKEIKDENSLWDNTVNSWGNQQISKDDKRNYKFHQNYHLNEPESLKNNRSQKYVKNQHKFNRIETMTIWEETSERWANDDDMSTAMLIDNEGKEKFDTKIDEESWSDALNKIEWGNNNNNNNNNTKYDEMKLRNWNERNEWNVNNNNNNNNNNQIKNSIYNQEWEYVTKSWNNNNNNNNSNSNSFTNNNEWNNQKDSIIPENSWSVNMMKNNYNFDSSSSSNNSFIGGTSQRFDINNYDNCIDQISWKNNNYIQETSNFTQKNDLMVMNNFYQNNIIDDARRQKKDQVDMKAKVQTIRKLYKNLYTRRK